jgi:hypothetical protein
VSHAEAATSPAMRWTGRATLAEIVVDRHVEVIELVARRDDVFLWQGESRTLAVIDRDRMQNWLNQPTETHRWGVESIPGLRRRSTRVDPTHCLLSAGSLRSSPEQRPAETWDLAIDDVVWSRRPNGSLTLTVDSHMPYHLGLELSTWLITWI